LLRIAAAALPSYMLPSTVMVLDGFPLAGPSHARRLALMSRPDSRTDCAEGRPVARPPKTS
ncbi:hypothetical protein, partial [Nocardia cyriacigeorgica]|uniref:hypothetical protein n=1 Tax=Nocardia cyriacigeorgica TaxID=135487 RepID=UPI0024556FD2